jgi:hypothetical protein
VDISAQVCSYILPLLCLIWGETIFIWLIHC